MMEEIGLKARLGFDGNAAIASMGRASTAFGRMQQSAKLAQRGVQNLKQGFAGFGVAVAAAGAGLGVTVKKFSDFEGQMGAVKAVLGKEHARTFDTLEKKAIELGSTTVFTAKQSAEAMENLARAGFTPAQILSSIGPTLDAAAAEGMDLATAADIVASNMKAFGLEAKDATHIADTLAAVSAKTNTNMVGLQEGMKFVAPVAKQMGFNLKETATTLGVLADVGIKGTLGGTALKNALLKIAKGAKSGHVSVGKFKAAVTGAKGEMLPLSKVMLNVVEQVQKIESPTKRAQAMMKLLGIRGMGAAGAFDALAKNPDRVKELFENFNTAGKAQEMARTRLDNLHGEFVKLSSAADGFAITMGKTLAPIVSKVVSGPGGLIETIGDTASAFQLLVSSGEKTTVVEQKLSKLNQTSVQFARGFMEGVQGAKDIFMGFASVVQGTVGFFRGLFSPPGLLGPEGSGVQGMVSMAMKATAFGLSIKVATGFLSRMGQVAVGTFRLIKGGLGMLKGAGGGIMSYLTKKFPALANKLPGAAKGLLKGVNALDKMTAQPVRVVNFDEAGGIGRGGVSPTSPLAPSSKGPVTKLGKAAGIASGVLSVAAAGALGYQLGTALDQALGLSNKISDAMVQQERDAAKKRAALYTKIVDLKTGIEQVEMYAKMAKAGTMINTGTGKRRAITQSVVRERLMAGALKGKSKAEQEAVLVHLKALIAKLPTKDELKARGQPLEVKVAIDGREVGKASVEAAQSARSRGARGKETRLKGKSR